MHCSQDGAKGGHDCETLLLELAGSAPAQSHPHVASLDFQKCFDDTCPALGADVFRGVLRAIIQV
eukprot:2388079-Alexandrium_andersonii.AAC.1